MIMREILFRGKRTDNNEWVDGCFYQESDCESYIIPSQTLWYVESDGDDFRAVYTAHRVNIDTIGQYTGIKDKNGTKIFEGDILKDRTTPEHGYYIVADLNKEQQLYYRDSRDGWVSKSVINFSNLITDSIKIIGNIHDNPELIK